MRIACRHIEKLLNDTNASCKIGPELTAYIQKLGWTIDASSAVVSIPPNPDNQIEATVVQEAIKLPREFSLMIVKIAILTATRLELAKIISHSVVKA